MDNLDINHGNAPRWKGTETGTILQLQTCPYNESHRVGHGSFASHLNNCRKALSEEDLAKYVICEYNATHHMFKEVYEDHLKTCLDFRFFNAEQFYLPPEFFGHPPAKSYMTEQDLKQQEKDRRKVEEEAEALRKRHEADEQSGRVVTEEDRRVRAQRELFRKTMQNAAEEEEFLGRNYEGLDAKPGEGKGEEAKSTATK